MKYFSIFLLTITAYANEAPIVNLHTNFGLIVLKLNPDKAPKTVENFLNYTNGNFYDDTIFHRVINNYIIQAGGYTENYKKKTILYQPIVNESDNGLENVYGTIAMARNYRDPDSATSQFFINLKDNISLDYNGITEEMGYTVFGKVIEGMDVVKKIASLKTEAKGELKKNVPQTPVLIELMVVKNDTGVVELPELSTVEPDTNENSPTDEILEDVSEELNNNPAIDEKQADEELINTVEVEEEIDKELTTQVNEIKENISGSDSNESPVEDVIEDELSNNDSKSSMDDVRVVQIPPKLAIFNVQIPTPGFIAEKIPIVDIIPISTESKAVPLLAPDMPSQPDIPEDPFPY